MNAMSSDSGCRIDSFAAARESLGRFDGHSCVASGEILGGYNLVDASFSVDAVELYDDVDDGGGVL